MAAANSIRKFNHLEGLTTCVAAGKATLNATGVIAAGATVDIAISDQKVKGTDVAFATLMASPDVDLGIAKVVCTRGVVTVTLVNTSGVNSTDGAATVGYFVISGT
jgi:hypothetical protein